MGEAQQPTSPAKWDGSRPKCSHSLNLKKDCKSTKKDENKQNYEQQPTTTPVVGKNHKLNIRYNYSWLAKTYMEHSSLKKKPG
jgi:hypothetical protein